MDTVTESKQEERRECSCLAIGSREGRRSKLSMVCLAITDFAHLYTDNS